LVRFLTNCGIVVRGDPAENAVSCLSGIGRVWVGRSTVGANRNRVLHVDTTNFQVYDTDDLNYFKMILDDIISDGEIFDSLAVKEREYLRMHLAAAIFRAADTGERDYALLKRGAIEAVSAVPFPYLDS
jgi:hypothetical protein